MFPDVSAPSRLRANEGELKGDMRKPALPAV